MANKKEKKTGKKKEEAPKKELLDMDEDLTIRAKFALSQISLKDDHRWRMKLSVWKILPKAYHDYTIKFVVDEEPFDIRIKSLEQKIELVEKEGSLFPDRDRKEITGYRELIAKVRGELRDLKEKCEVIEFVSEIEEIKYKDGNTIVLMKIPDVVIEPLNKSKLLIGHYKIELLPLI